MDKEFRRTLIISATVIGMSIVLFGSAFAWIASHLEEKAQAASSARAILSQQARVIETLARLKRNTIAVGAIETKLGFLLPTKDGLLDFSRGIDAIARSHNLAFTFSFQGATALPTAVDAGYVGFAFQTTGPLETLSKFFDEIENNSQKFLMAIDSFDLVREGANYRVSAQGKVFYQ